MKKENEKKPEITQTVSTINDKIVEFNSIKIVTKTGTGGHVMLPRELIGRLVRISLEKEVQ